MGISASVYDRDAPATQIIALTKANQRGWRDELKEVGSGQIFIPESSPDLVAAPTLKDKGNIIRYALDDTDEFAWIIEKRELVLASSEEKAGNGWRLSGRGVIALLEKALVWPEAPLPSSQRQRPFDYTAIAYDDSSWIAATEVQVFGATSPIAAWDSKPVGWPDAPPAHTGSKWIWSRAVTGSGVPAGSCFFRKKFTLSATTVVRVYVTCDNNHKTFLDGQQILENFPRESAVDWSEAQSATLTLGAGDHQLAVEGINYDFVAGGTSPAGLLVAVMEVLEGGALGTVLVHSDNTWLALDYPDAIPGMTVGEILRILIEEDQARGGLAGVTLGFTDALDSDGNAWTAGDLINGEYTINITLDIGANLLNVAKMFDEQFADLHMTPTLQLDAYNLDTYGTDLTGSVDLLVGTHFAELSLDDEEHEANAILGRDTDGNLVAVDYPGATLPRHEWYVEIATAPDENRAQVFSERLVDEFAIPSIQLTGRVIADAGPYSVWKPGDKIQCPGLDGTATETNVIALTVGEDQAANPTFVLEGTQDDATA